MTSRQRKRERREVYSVTKATPSYLNWSEDTISFGREDHPHYVPNPRQYPLVVDPIIGNTRFSNVLMGIGLDKLRTSKLPFHDVVPGKRVQPLGQIDLPVCFVTPANFHKEVLTFEWWGSGEPTTPSLGVPVTPSSW